VHAGAERGDAALEGIVAAAVHFHIGFLISLSEFDQFAAYCFCLSIHVHTAVLVHVPLHRELGYPKSRRLLPAAKPRLLKLRSGDDELIQQCKTLVHPSHTSPQTVPPQRCLSSARNSQRKSVSHPMQPPALPKRMGTDIPAAKPLWPFYAAGTISRPPPSRQRSIARFTVGRLVCGLHRLTGDVYA